MMFLQRVLILEISIIILAIFSLLPITKTGLITISQEIEINYFLLAIVFSIILVLSVGEITSIRKELEKRHKIDLSDVQVRYSDNISKAFNIYHSPEMRPEIKEKKSRYELMKKGLQDYELEDLDLSKPVIFIPRAYENYPARLYGAINEEFGHQTAYRLDVKNKTFNEAFAIAYRLRGILLGYKIGKFTLDEAIDQIEHDIKEAEYDSRFLSSFEKAGLKIPSNIKHYENALFAIRKYNPDLEFRNRDPDELIEELEGSIKYILSFSEKIKHGLKQIKDKISSSFKRQ